MVTACLMCSFPGFPWSVRLLNPSHVYYAWAIVIVAPVLAALPFLLGYRIGPPMPYSWKAHVKFFLLFALFPLLYGSSFGGSLAVLCMLPEILLQIVTAILADHAGFWITIASLVIVHIFYTWIIVKIDRPLIKPEKTKPERDMTNGKTD